MKDLESPAQHYKYLWDLPLPLLLAEKTNVETELKKSSKTGRTCKAIRWVS